MRRFTQEKAGFPTFEDDTTSPTLNNIQMTARDITSVEAKAIGRKCALKATGIIVAALILLLFVLIITQMRSEDGITYFIAGLTNIGPLCLLALLFALTSFFGGQAGKEVILEKKSFLWVGFKYAVLTILIIGGYCLFLLGETSLNMTMCVLLMPLTFCVWLWVTGQLGNVRDRWKTLNKNCHP
jgi:hypothetical protein